jgi:hypothetical protein
MRRLAHRWTVLFAALAGLLITVPAAAAAAGKYGYMSNGFGITDDSDPAPVTFLGATPDTQTVAFSTADPLEFVDHDGKEDVYMDSGSLLLTPLSSPLGANDPEFDPASVKVLPGGGVLFTSRNQIGGSEDSATDLFLEPSFGAPLVDLSDPPSDPNDINVPSNVVVATDGSFAFTTQANLLPADTQSGVQDVYRSRDGTLTLVTSGAAQGTSTGISADGSRVFWESGVAQQPCAGDADGGAFDVYSSAAPFMVADSPTCVYAGSGESGAGAVSGVSPSGSTVALRTRESFIGADGVAGSYDLYAFTGAAAAKRLTALDGAEPAGQPTVLRACDDGDVLFTTARALTAADQDVAVDVYRSNGTTTTLMTPGASTGAADQVVATSADCADVMWATTAKESADDADAATDLYGADDGGPAKLISAVPAGLADGSVQVPAGPPQTLHATLAFTTTQQLSPADADGGADDVYEYDRASGATWFVSTFTKTDARAQDLAAASDDGNAVIVASTVALPSGTGPDDDGALDLYRYTLVDDDQTECGCFPPPVNPPSNPPAANPPSAKPVPAAAPARPKLSFTTKGLAVKRRGRTTSIVTRIKVACPAGSATSCTVTFATKAGRKAYASSKATIKSGKSATLSITLSSKALKQLKKAKRLKLAFTITARRSGGADVRKTFSATLRAPRR